MYGSSCHTAGNSWQSTVTYMAAGRPGMHNRYEVLRYHSHFSLFQCYLISRLHPKVPQKSTSLSGSHYQIIDFTSHNIHKYPTFKPVNLQFLRPYRRQHRQYSHQNFLYQEQDGPRRNKNVILSVPVFDSLPLSKPFNLKFRVGIVNFRC